MNAMTMMIDHTVLKKRLSTYESEKGRIRNVPAEVLSEVLRAWESWTGTSKDFYSSVGVSQKQMAVLIGKAKKMKREGHFPADEFQEIQIGGGGSSPTSSGGPFPGFGACGSGTAIELCWSEGKMIRFGQVDEKLLKVGDWLKEA